MKSRLHKKQQNCNKLLTLFTMGIAMLTGVVAMGLCTIRESYHQAKAASYDDESYSITLSIEELSYTYENLQTYVNSLGSDMIPNFMTGRDENATYTFILMGMNGNNMVNGQGTPNTYAVVFNNPNYNGLQKFVFTIGNVISDFNSDLTLVIPSTYYSDFKNAVELDIAANQPVEPTQPMLDFISIIVSGIGAFATGVASGVSDFASALFLKVENGAVVGLSVFGGIVAIFAGLALAVAITTKVYLWITSLGN